MMNRFTLQVFVRRLQRIQRLVEAADPQGVDWALRLAVSSHVYFCYDALRCQELPFDREAFARPLERMEALVRHYPRVGRRRHRDGMGGRRPARPEALVADLYSRCWSHYDDEMFLGTIGLFEERFRLNNVALNFLRGAECLDAGCGSGRYTIAMAQLGAKRAIGIDISTRAVEEAAQRSRRLGADSQVEFVHGSVINMPREWTDRFDFVCSNGVVHHTLNPTRGLEEIFRVLKPGGRAYIFVYGGGGLFWEVVDFVRALAQSVPMAFADQWLQQMGWPAGKVFNAMDHWYTPLQERITRRTFEGRLRYCGFIGLRYLPRAKVYDASERRYRFPKERDLVGEGDLRYLVEKPLHQPRPKAGARHHRAFAGAA